MLADNGNYIVKLISWHVTSGSVSEVARPHDIAFSVSIFWYKPINRWFERVPGRPFKVKLYAGPVARTILSTKKLGHELLSDIKSNSSGSGSCECTSDHHADLVRWNFSPFLMVPFLPSFTDLGRLVRLAISSGSLSVCIAPHESVKSHAYHAVAVGLASYRLSRTVVLVTTLADTTKVMLAIIKDYIERAFWKFPIGEIAVDLVGCGHRYPMSNTCYMHGHYTQQASMHHTMPHSTT